MKNSPLVLVLCLLTSRSRAEPSAAPVRSFSSSQCQHQVQEEIYSSLPACLPRRTLVDLRQFFAEDHDIIQVRGVGVICTSQVPDTDTHYMLINVLRPRTFIGYTCRCCVNSSKRYFLVSNSNSSKSCSS